MRNRIFIIGAAVVLILAALGLKIYFSKNGAPPSEKAIESNGAGIESEQKLESKNIQEQTETGDPKIDLAVDFLKVAIEVNGNESEEDHFNKMKIYLDSEVTSTKGILSYKQVFPEHRERKLVVMTVGKAEQKKLYYLVPFTVEYQENNKLVKRPLFVMVMDQVEPMVIGGFNLTPYAAQ